LEKAGCNAGLLLGQTLFRAWQKTTRWNRVMATERLASPFVVGA
jgi:hypothetical protein